MDMTPFLAAIPSTYGIYAAIVIIFCKIFTIIIVVPAPTSRWAKPYAVINAIALNIGWAANRLQVGRAGIMVQAHQISAAHAALTNAGIPHQMPNR